MKRYAILLLLLIGLQAYSITVEVEQVLDAPPTKWGSFFDDSAVYVNNGELLFKSTLASNIYILSNGEWLKLIKSYKTDDYNQIENQEFHRCVNYLYNSMIPYEFLYKISQANIPDEHYRIYFNDSNILQSELITKEYYKNKLLIDPDFGLSLGLGFCLNNDLKIELTPLEDGLQAYWPDIVDGEGHLVYRFTDEFRKGFVEDTWTITTNPDRDRVAMVISFLPEKGSPYFKPGFWYLKKLVIFKIDYAE